MAGKSEKPSKEVAELPKGGAVAVYDYGADAGGGFENTSGEDFSIPFVGVLQSNSPELETIDGAKAGQIINSVTKELVDGAEGIPFVPCYTDHVYVEWRPRDAGGGIVAVHKLDSAAVKEARDAMRVGKYKNAAGNEMVETFYVYGIGFFSEGPMAVVASFTSTKIKIYKAWLTRAKTIQVILPNGQKVNPPLFAHTYRLRSAKEENAKGKFYNFEIVSNEATLEASRLAPDDPIYVQARDLRDAVISGIGRAATESLSGSEASGGENGGAGAGTGGKKEGKAPF